MSGVFCWSAINGSVRDCTILLRLWMLCRPHSSGDVIGGRRGRHVDCSNFRVGIRERNLFSFAVRGHHNLGSAY